MENKDISLMGSIILIILLLILIVLIRLVFTPFVKVFTYDDYCHYNYDNDSYYTPQNKENWKIRSCNVLIDNNIKDYYLLINNYSHWEKNKQKGYSCPNFFDITKRECVMEENKK